MDDWLLFQLSNQVLLVCLKVIRLPELLNIRICKSRYQIEREKCCITKEKPVHSCTHRDFTQPVARQYFSLLMFDDHMPYSSSRRLQGMTRMI